MWICLDPVGLRGIRGCRLGRACATVSLAGLVGLGFWWICLDSVGLRGLTGCRRGKALATVSLAGL